LKGVPERSVRERQERLGELFDVATCHLDPDLLREAEVFVGGEHGVVLGELLIELLDVVGFVRSHQLLVRLGQLLDLSQDKGRVLEDATTKRRRSSDKGGDKTGIQAQRRPLRTREFWHTHRREVDELPMQQQAHQAILLVRFDHDRAH